MLKTQKKKRTVMTKTNIEPALETAEEKISDEIIPDIEESELETESLTHVSEEKASIISIIKGLEGQVETAFKLKKVLEAELDTIQQNFSEEKEARTQLEVEINLLQSRAVLTEQLRQDISFVEEERNKFFEELGRTREEFEQAATERDSLTKQLSSFEANLKELESEKMALEAQVINLKNNITDTKHLRKDLAEITQAHRQSKEQVHDLTKRLKTAETSKSALETQLAEIHQNAQNLRTETEQLRRKVTSGDSRTADLRIQLEDQQAANQEMMEINTHLENQIKMVNINYDAVKKELDAFKNALRDIRHEVTRTSGHVRQRYFQPKEANSSNLKKEINSVK